MGWGKLVGQVLAAPVKIAVSIPDESAKAVDEIAKELFGEGKKQ